jgi:hypothetical protein
MSTEYYSVLGISERSGISEIKSAYRRLAKKYHPDISDHPNAKEKFILINEAYEFLIRLKTNPPSSAPYQAMDPKMRDELYRQWLKRERMKARARAAQAARKKFEEFKNSPIYRTSQIIFTFYDYLSISIGLLIILGGAVGLYVEAHDKGINANHIVATSFLLLLGILFILFSVSSIRNRNR